MELTYRQQSDFLIPNLTAPEAPNIGKYGMLRETYLKTHLKATYTGMVLAGTLKSHLEEIDRVANEMAERLISQMAVEQNVTESLKASDQMEWVRRMNAIRSSAEEMVLSELIYSA